MVPDSRVCPNRIFSPRQANVHYDLLGAWLRREKLGMYNQRGRTPRRPVYPPYQPPNSWPESGPTDWYDNAEAYYAPRRSIRDWISSLSPAQQLSYGCVGVAMIGAVVLYCLAGAAWVARPVLLQRPPTPTDLIRPTLAPTPTQLIAPTLSSLPKGTLIATPTQAPIPTREPVTPTQPGDLPIGTPGTFFPTLRPNQTLPAGFRPSPTFPIFYIQTLTPSPVRPGTTPTRTRISKP